MARDFKVLGPKEFPLDRKLYAYETMVISEFDLSPGPSSFLESKKVLVKEWKTVNFLSSVKQN